MFIPNADVVNNELFHKLSSGLAGTLFQECVDGSEFGKFVDIVSALPQFQACCHTATQCAEHELAFIFLLGYNLAKREAA